MDLRPAALYNAGLRRAVASGLHAYAHTPARSVAAVLQHPDLAVPRVTRVLETGNIVLRDGMHAVRML
jgi:hypothetical protein